MIQKAKVKKAYAKIKAQSQTQRQPYPTLDSIDTADVQQLDPPKVPHTSLELHPDRQAMLSETPVYGEQRSSRHLAKIPRSHRTKPSSFDKELAIGARRRTDSQTKAEARLAREKERKAMSKAKRPGKNGVVKLGRQGTVLLSRIQRLSAEGRL